ncbi:MAG: hypothetical protein CM15mP89_2360 [Gammaproteobacteria bacterium]|nr:MAG: hypothetical protein CM15mP89_2360 [Gammaproteobacteria bacterium]
MKFTRLMHQAPPAIPKKRILQTRWRGNQQRNPTKITQEAHPWGNRADLPQAMGRAKRIGRRARAPGKIMVGKGPPRTNGAKTALTSRLVWLGVGLNPNPRAGPNDKPQPR